MELFNSALIMLVVGMGFVFVFLFIQVWVTNIFAKIGAKYSYLLQEPAKTVKKAEVAPSAAVSNAGEVVAVMAAALKESGKLPQ